MKSGTKKIFLFSKQYSRTICVLFFATAALYSLTTLSNKWVKSTLFSYSTVDITCTNFYSSQIKRKIVSFVQSYVSNANCLSFDAANFYSSLREHFNCVARVTITKRFPMGFHIHIKGIDPVMRINNTCILAKNCSMYLTNDFAKFIGLEALPHITIPTIGPGMKITSTAYKDLQKLATKYNEKYMCTYHNPSLIQLVPRKQTHYTSILTNDAALDKEISTQLLDKVVEDSLRRGLCTQKALDKKIRSIELDMRFEQRIIVKMIDHGKQGRGV